MQLNKRWIRVFTVVLVAMSMGTVACGGAQKKTDDQKVATKTTADELGMSEEALGAFQVALAEIAKKKPDYKLAVENLRTAVELEPDFAEAYYNLGILLMELDQSAEAIAPLERAKEIDPEVLDYTVALGRAYAATGKTDDAEPLFLEVVAREPANLAAKNNLAALNLQRGEIDKALKYLQEILREDDQNVPAIKTMGLVYKKQDNKSLAKYMFNKAAKIDAKDADLHNNLGLVFMSEENVPRAVNEFQKAIDVDPNYLEARLNLGSILLEYLDYKRANEQFVEAVRISPDHCVARLGSAASAYALGEHQRSADNYQYYVDKCDADHRSSYERLAKLNETFLNNPKAAIGYYEKLLALAETEDQKTQYNAMINFLQSQLKSNQQKAPEATETTPEEGDVDGADEGAAEDDGE